MTRDVPPSGWYVEVEHPTSGHVFTPSVVGSPERNPRVNDLPRLRVPVEKNDRWRELSTTDASAPFRVWKDGIRQPVDEVETVEQKAEHTVLEGRGGLELRTRVNPEYDFEKVHTAAENLIVNNTVYTANVDAPNTDTQSNVTVQQMDTEAEFQGRFKETDPYNPIYATTTGSYGDGEVLTVGQTGRVRETNNISNSTVSTFLTASDASNGDAVELASTGDYVEYTFNPDHTIPSGETRVAHRHRFREDPDGDGNYESPDIDVYVDGELVGGYAETFETSDNSWQWKIWDPSNADRDDVTFRVECSGNPQGGSIDLDLMVVFDARYHSTAEADFDNTVDANGYLSSPTEYPMGATAANYPQREFEDAETIHAITAGGIDVDVNDAGAIDAIELSNDLGKTWTDGGAGTTSFNTTFSSIGPAIRTRLSVGATDATRTTATPTQGYEAGEVNTATVTADTEDVPIIVNQSFDGQLRDILTKLADQGDYVFEFRRSDGTDSVEWTTPGQRTQSSEPSLSDYKVKKTTEGQVEKAIVYGSSRPVTGEKFTSNHGSFVALNESRLLSSRETVRDPSSGQVFNRGEDYEMDYTDGRIKTLTDGDMSDATTYEVNYDFRTNGEYTADGVTDPVTKVENVPALTTDRGCRMAAARIVDELQTVQWQADVSLPTDETGWSVVDAIPLPEGVPETERLHIRDVKNTPEKTAIRLGSSLGLDEVVAQINQRVQSVSEKV